MKQNHILVCVAFWNQEIVQNARETLTWGLIIAFHADQKANGSHRASLSIWDGLHSGVSGAVLEMQKGHSFGSTGGRVSCCVTAGHHLLDAVCLPKPPKLGIIVINLNNDTLPRN